MTPNISTKSSTPPPLPKNNFFLEISKNIGIQNFESKMGQANIYENFRVLPIPVPAVGLTTFCTT